MPGSLGNFQSGEWSKAFGLVATVGERGGSADGPKSGVERRIWKFIKGASVGKRKSSGLPGGARLAGEGLARCLRDRASGFGSLMGLWSVSEAARI